MGIQILTSVMPEQCSTSWVWGQVGAGYYVGLWWAHSWWIQIYIYIYEVNTQNSCRESGLPPYCLSSAKNCKDHKLQWLLILQLLFKRLGSYCITESKLRMCIKDVDIFILVSLSHINFSALHVFPPFTNFRSLFAFSPQSPLEPA